MLACAKPAAAMLLFLKCCAELKVIEVLMLSKMGKKKNKGLSNKHLRKSTAFQF